MIIIDNNRKYIPLTVNFSFNYFAVGVSERQSCSHMRRDLTSRYDADQTLGQKYGSACSGSTILADLVHGPPTITTTRSYYRKESAAVAHGLELITY